ncbi:tripartite tricarboxylate transporter substrate binding protein [Pseudoruegeria sp. HB172150]|uniref:Bug family tripartite tricarboxylate transporter substrate binding protein n=1 Tax=Pseudoruegeria sp. HB172150 TaxID=2721164 RepID=UPI0015533599|nr:tripartite tricarboxylate transporter substrate binding protein [Pseudoruegeria sp. HB172150]
MKQRLAKIAIATGLALAAVATSAPAQEFPDKPITMMIGFRPGGAVDTTGRLIAEKMSETLGVPVTGVTKSGGGGTVMAAELINSEPDGYTIGMGASAAYTLAPQLNSDLPFKIDDFDHLATLTYPSDAIVISADSEYNSMEEMIAAHKESGDPITFASQVSASRLMVAAISKATGVEFRVIPVQGGADGIKEVLGGHIDMTWSGSGWTEQVRAGTMKPLATMAADRMEDYPDVPTLLDLGYDFTFVDTFMLSAPKGVPEDRMAILVDAIEKAISDPAVQETLREKIGLQTKYRGPEETTDFLHQQYDAVAPLVDAASG